MKDPHLNLLINENRSQAHGVNMAAQCAYRQGYRYMIRMDAHAEYIHGFSTQLLRVLCDKNADSVTVPLIAMSQQVSGWQAANAKLQRSRLGHGNAAHRQNTGSGWVQHGHHAAFRLVCFQALGGMILA
jgi:succinoglycan biosynthesis protein ExoA